MSNTFCLDFAPRVLNKHVALLFYFRKFSPLFLLRNLIHRYYFFSEQISKIFQPTRLFVLYLYSEL